MRREEYLQGILGALGVGEDKGVPEPVWRQEEYLAAIYEAIKNLNPASISTWKQLVSMVRDGTASTYVKPGDPYYAAKESGVSVTVFGDITAATVSEETFINAIGHSDAAAYEFIFDGAAWTLRGDVVELSNYGITPTGTPAEGDTIVVHVSADEIVLETVGIGCDVPVNPNLDNSISFLTRDVQTYGSIARCAPQALVSVQTAIASGAKAYVKGDHCAYDGSTTEDGNFGFVAPGDIPAGARIRHSELGKYQSSADDYTKAKVLSGKWTIYAADYSVLYSNVETIEDDTGALLGTVTAKDPQYLENGTAGHVNFTQRNQYGSNRAAHAAHNKWLNSDAAGAGPGEIASWWAPSDEFDMPIKSTLPGWLHGLDPEFRSCLAKVWKRTAKSISDGYGYEDTQELVWVPSMTEVGFGNNNSVVETSPKGSGGDPNWTGAYPLYDGASNADRIKYLSNTARYWFLRSPVPSYAYSVLGVSTGGSLSNDGAVGAGGAVAGLCIA